MHFRCKLLYFEYKSDLLMRKLLLLLFALMVNLVLSAQSFSLLSWNIQDFGKTKNEREISSIAKIVQDFDIVAIQEVVAIDPGGAQAVARLAEQLNRSGTKWDYRISDPTQSPKNKTERYAFLWKENEAKLIGSPWLDT